MFSRELLKILTMRTPPLAPLVLEFVTLEDYPGQLIIFENFFNSIFLLAFKYFTKF